jgi:hypothetical protein
MTGKAQFFGRAELMMHHGMPVVNCAECLESIDVQAEINCAPVRTRLEDLRYVRPECIGIQAPCWDIESLIFSHMRKMAILRSV